MPRVMNHAWVLLPLLASCADYPYRHEIAGKVIAGGQPLAGATVMRVNDKGDPYGQDEINKRTTAADGSFSFVAEGRGPSPMPYAPWNLKITHPKYAERVLEVRAAWSDDKSKCFGYCAKDFDIELR